MTNQLRPSEGTDEPVPGRYFAQVLIYPNVAVIGVWAFTLFNESALNSPVLGFLIYLPTMCCGGPASLLGAVVSLGMLLREYQTDQTWWLACLAANVAGSAVSFLAFIVYLAPGC